MKKPCSTNSTKQLSLFKEKRQTEFGGSLNQGKRKEKRPFSSKLVNHLVLKAESSEILLRHKDEIENTIRRMNDKFQIKNFGIGVQPDHVHLAQLNPSRQAYNAWARSLTGMLSRRFKIKWRLRPYTRLVTWGRDFETVKGYLEFNKREGEFILARYCYVEKWLQTILNKIVI